MTLQVDILYTADCSDWQEAVDLTQAALAELGLEAEINYHRIENDRQALQTYFIGSPTVRVDGYDLFPVEGATAGLRLRSYLTEEGLRGCPTYAMLVAALRPFVA